MVVRTVDGVLDIIDLQDQMSFIVQTYFRDTPNWNLAKQKIEPLLIDLTSFFKEFIESGERPIPNQYWHFFAGITAEVCFNYAVALINYADTPETYNRHDFEKAENALLTAGFVLPKGLDHYEPFLGDIEVLYVKSLQMQASLTTMSLKENIISNDSTLDDNLRSFYSHIRKEYVPS